MHSSRMRTDRLLTVCPCCSSGVHQLWDASERGAHPGGGCILGVQSASPVNRMTHACENITFPASLRYVVGNYNTKRQIWQISLVDRRDPRTCALFGVKFFHFPQDSPPTFIVYRPRSVLSEGYVFTFVCRSLCLKGEVTLNASWDRSHGHSGGGLALGGR